jgi:HlyD family secretion protein
MRRIGFVLLIAALIAAAIFVYFHYRDRKNEDFLVLYGNVDVRQVDLGFRVGGILESLFFEEGDFVSEGAVMAMQQQQPYLDQYKEAEATILSTKASLLNAENLFKRRQELIGDGGVSEEDLQQTETNRDVLLANLKQAEASLGVALKNLNDTIIRCPTDGIILTRVREPGTVCNVADPVFTLNIISPVWIRAFVTEPDLGKIYPGMPAEVFTDSKALGVFHGRIGFISPVAEFTPKTVETTQLRTDLVYRIRVYVDNPNWYLKQGMPVTVRLDLRAKNNSEEKPESDG